MNKEQKNQVHATCTPEIAKAFGLDRLPNHLVTIIPEGQIHVMDTLEGHIDQKDVVPGLAKLAQFRKALKLRGTPDMGAQDGKGDQATVYVKIFDPTGGHTFYITEFDGMNEAFGYVTGDFPELGYMNLAEMANIDGQWGIGLEIDVHFIPTTLAEVRRL